MCEGSRGDISGTGENGERPAMMSPLRAAAPPVGVSRAATPVGGYKDYAL